MNIVSRLEMKLSQIMKIKNIILNIEIILPKDDIVFHNVSLSG
ncbi:MAG: hypothetical protein ACJBCI_06480 [Candidatus Tisiphia sp.]